MADELIKTKYFANLMSQIVEFRRDDTFCDFDVIVGSKVFKCHRLVLSAASKYFYAKLKRIMFDEGRSCATTEITLPITAEADIFELILEFIYIGYVAIHRSNVYDLIRAANYYQVPSIVELCTKFVEENLNVLVEDVSKLLSFAHDMGLEQLEELLSGHVLKNFGHIYEFSKFTLESAAPISDTKPTNGPIMLNKFQEIVHSRFNRKEVTTFETKLLQSDKDEMNFDGIAAELATPSERAPIECFQWPGNKLHAYVSRWSVDQSIIGTSIYTYSLDGNISATGEWSYTGEMEYSSTFMRCIYMDGRLYSLNYLANEHYHIDHQQTFRCSNFISMNRPQSLKAPPYYLPEFDLCGARNHIYVCSKVIPPVRRSIIYAPNSRGLFYYRRDMNWWFALPDPPNSFNEARMTCDDDGIVYLIGGEYSNTAIYAYDPRQQEWFSVLSARVHSYEEAACCVYGKKIYIAGGFQDPTRAEVYDPIARNLHRLRDFAVPRFYDQVLVNWHSPIPDERNRIVCFSQLIYGDRSRIEHLNPEMNSAYWRLMPNLYLAVIASGVDFDDLFILDMISLY